MTVNLNGDTGAICGQGRKVALPTITDLPIESGHLSGPECRKFAVDLLCHGGASEERYCLNSEYDHSGVYGILLARLSHRVPGLETGPFPAAERKLQLLPGMAAIYPAQTLQCYEAPKSEPPTPIRARCLNILSIDVSC